MRNLPPLLGPNPTPNSFCLQEIPLLLGAIGYTFVFAGEGQKKKKKKKTKIKNARNK